MGCITDKASSCCDLLVVSNHVLNISFQRRLVNSAEADVDRNTELDSTKFSLEVSIGAAYQRNDRLSS